jgi:alkylation response protein AidB-like acyl-CoA dehydrogenase
MVRTGGTGRSGISACWCRRTRPASPSAPTSARWAGTRSRRAQVIFEDARVPAANLLGEEGQGFRIAMAGLDGGRLNIAACSLGGAQAALDIALAYVQRAQGLRQALAISRTLQFKLADMATELEAARALLWRACAKLDAKAPDATNASAPWPSASSPTPASRRQRGAAAARRLRLSRRLRHREDRARPARPPDPRRHQRDHARDQEGFVSATMPAIDAVETICPPSPCVSISGPKISMPQIDRQQVHPITQFHPASFQVP